MVDGTDGSGKSTIVSAWKKYLTDQGNAIFDLKKYWIDDNKYPDLKETHAYEFIFSAEMTNVGIGQVIREELINKNNHYPPLAIAQAYSLDRLILYTKIIIPILQMDKIIIQDRGVSSSLAYQSSMDGLDINTVADLIGNKNALEHRPDYLIIVDTDPEIATKRITGRTDKQDNAIFEQLETITKIHKKFHSPEYQKLFTDRGTKIIYLNGNEKIDIMETQAIDLLKSILK